MNGYTTTDMTSKRKTPIGINARERKGEKQ
jgi:hypothetical protein